MLDNIYSMGLHDTLWINTELEVTRVPGGWLYTTFKQYDYDQSFEIFSSTTFVPYNFEFAPEINTDLPF